MAYFYWDKALDIFFLLRNLLRFNSYLNALIGFYFNLAIEITLDFKNLLISFSAASICT